MKIKVAPGLIGYDPGFDLSFLTRSSLEQAVGELEEIPVSRITC